MPFWNSPHASYEQKLVGLELGPCGSVLPIGVMITQGYYDASNISQAKPLQLYKPGVYFSPDNWGVEGYIFAPLSDSATLLPAHFQVSVTWQGAASGYWINGTPPVFQFFTSGVYTLIAGDSWGELTMLYFTV